MQFSPDNFLHKLLNPLFSLFTFQSTISFTKVNSIRKRLASSLILLRRAITRCSTGTAHRRLHPIAGTWRPRSLRSVASAWRVVFRWRWRAFPCTKKPPMRWENALLRTASYFKRTGLVAVLYLLFSAAPKSLTASSRPDLAFLVLRIRLDRDRSGRLRADLHGSGPPGFTSMCHGSLSFKGFPSALDRADP